MHHMLGGSEVALADENDAVKTDTFVGMQTVCLRRSLNSQTADDGFCTFSVKLLSIEFRVEETLGVMLESASSVKKHSC